MPVSKKTWKNFLGMFLSICFFCMALTAKSEGEMGFLPVKNSSPKEYYSLPQIWSITQDNRGVIYVGNRDGVLEFDGTNWRKIVIGNNLMGRSLCVDSNGRIYVGAEDDFGYLRPDPEGRMFYVSLIAESRLPDTGFGDIWKTFSIGDSIVFQSSTSLFIYDGSNVERIKSINSFSNSFLVNNQLFVCETNKGIYVLKNDSLVFLDGSGLFGEKDLFMLLPWRNDTLFGVTHKNGAFLIKYLPQTNAVKSVPFKTEIDSLLINNRVYNGMSLPDGNFSIGTFNGIVVIDNNGKFQYALNKQSGIIDDNIKTQFLDRDNNLWIGTSNGLSMVQVSSPISFFQTSQGLKGTVESITRHGEPLYIASSLGVFSLKPSNNFNGQHRIADVSGVSPTETWIVKSYQTESVSILLCEQNDHILEIKPRLDTVYVGVPWTIGQSNSKSNTFYFGSENGVETFLLNNFRWEYYGKIPGVDKRITDVMEDFEGNLWLASETEGVYKISRNGNANIGSTVTFYNDSVNLPGGPYIFVWFRNEILLGTAKGIYRFNKAQNQFSEALEFKKAWKGKTPYIHRLSVDCEKHLWAVTYIEEEERDEVGFFTVLKDSTLNWNPTPFLGNIHGQINALFHDSSGVTWLGGNEGLFRFDNRIKANYQNEFQCLLRKIKLGEDSTIFYGAFQDSKMLVTANQPTTHKPILDYLYNSLIFEYSAMNVDPEHPTQYCYLLEGYDKKWSEWTTETKKEYTNLFEGTYTFKVKAKNIYLHETEPATFVFDILPPWYRTWVAYFGFILAAFALIYLFVKQYTRYLRGVIREKTAEIRQQKDEIEKINEEITSSIKYAERIQKAIVPTYQKASEVLPEHFVLWRPRDIVSGDFWWMTQKNGLVVIVAADCTGHGVPGAFMSMLGVSFLNEIVNKNEITTANVILDDLRHHVKSTLKQTGKEGEAKDGMDLALIVLDIENQRIQYAGAYNPLYLIRQNELIEFKADRNPIGIFIKEVDSFTNNLIEIQKGDTLYIFSDGFVDQFGGSDGRKFKSKQFKELLLAIQDRSMLEQEMILDKTIDEWRGEMAQVDDILVLGIRI
ncbi:MAG: SpoIIE family protein phosphatase [Salinivirgaceae bacterium]|nr:SpoIIE family protein phosphatase [Salinivirgaceae bacterium]